MEKKKYIWEGSDPSGNRTTLELDSKEELHFQYWLEEAVKNGYVHDWKYHPIKWELTPVKYWYKKKQLKTKAKLETRVLLRAHTYEPDWKIYPTKKFSELRKLFTGELPKDIVMMYDDQAEQCFYVDVKGSYNQNDAWRRFEIDRKMVYDKFDVYVNKIIPESWTTQNKHNAGFFEKTWCPKKAFFGKRGKAISKYNMCKLITEL